MKHMKTREEERIRILKFYYYKLRYEYFFFFDLLTSKHFLYRSISIHWRKIIKMTFVSLITHTHTLTFSCSLCISALIKLIML